MIEIQPRLAGDLVVLEPLRENHLEELYGIASDKRIWEQHPVKDRHTH